jgi:hypothetical protein
MNQDVKISDGWRGERIERAIGRDVHDLSFAGERAARHSKLAKPANTTWTGEG